MLGAPARAALLDAALDGDADRAAAVFAEALPGVEAALPASLRPATAGRMAPWLARAARRFSAAAVAAWEPLIERAAPGLIARTRAALAAPDPPPPPNAHVLLAGGRRTRAALAGELQTAPAMLPIWADLVGGAPNALVAAADAGHRERAGRHLFYPPNFRPARPLTAAQASALAALLQHAARGAAFTAAGTHSPGIPAAGRAVGASAARRRAWEGWYKHPGSNPLAASAAERLARAGVAWAGFPDAPRGCSAPTALSEALGAGCAGTAQFALVAEGARGRVFFKTVTAYGEAWHRAKELWAKLPAVRAAPGFRPGRDRLALLVDGDWGGPKVAPRVLASLAPLVDALLRPPPHEAPWDALTAVLAD